METNISDWRRQTFGDLTSALGFSNGKATTFPPRLPATIGEFWEAEHEVATLPAATIPGADQTPPVQEKRRPRIPWTPQPRHRRARRARGRCRPRPAASSRTAPRTRPTSSSGGSDKVYLKKIAAVENKDVVAAATEHDVRVRPGDRWRQRRDRRHLDDGAGVGGHERDDEPLRGRGDPGRQRGLGDRVGDEHGVGDPDRRQHPEQDREHRRRRHLPARDRDHARRQDGVRREHRAEHGPGRLRDGLGGRRLKPDARPAR